MSREQIGQFLNDITLMTDTDKSDGDVVRLMSVHSSKWLEFEYVFVVGCEEGTFPWQQATMDPDELEEERRLMYVAITRAKDHLFLSHVNTRMIRGRTTTMKWSRFLEELPQDLIKNYDLWWSGGTRKRVAEMEVGMRVRNKLFGLGTIREVWGDMVVVLFDKSSIGLRKMDKRMVEKILGN